MPKTILNVPYKEKDQAKGLGAKWDADQKVWYVPDGLDTAPFQDWIPKTPEEPFINVRADSYTLIESVQECRRCKRLTKMFGFLLAPGHESLQMDEEEDEKGNPLITEPSWEVSNTPCLLANVDYIAPKVLTQVKKLTNTYFMDRSQTLDADYYMNHCQFCKIKQGDFFAYREPGGAFFPDSAKQFEMIKTYEIKEPFQAACQERGWNTIFEDLPNFDPAKIHIGYWGL